MLIPLHWTPYRNLSEDQIRQLTKRINEAFEDVCSPGGERYFCRGCGAELTEEHYQQCKMIPCRCGGLRSEHSGMRDYCFHCPCEKFVEYLSYEEYKKKVARRENEELPT